MTRAEREAAARIATLLRYGQRELAEQATGSDATRKDTDMRRPPEAYRAGFCSEAQTERWDDALILLSHMQEDGTIERMALARDYPNRPFLHNAGTVEWAAQTLGCKAELDYLTESDD
jgi:hypothetical protein